MTRRKLVIFGTGDIAQLAAYYFRTDSEYDVKGFTVDRAYLGATTFEGLPLVPFEEVEHHFPVKEHELFVALSYARMNRLRETKFHEARAKGYTLASYISSRCSYLAQQAPGPNAFILEDNTVQPFVRIGENVTLWSGNHIGHHSVIEGHNFISSHVVISGHCHIASHCFLGVNSTLAHKVRLAEGTLLGAGAVIAKDTEPNTVHVAPRSVKLDKSSEDIRL
jgi:sugar O-acyltransferase (sialic acid O-acetyltransferase NeuD family)